jgi:hypothetical protein
MQQAFPKEDDDSGNPSLRRSGRGAGRRRGGLIVIVVALLACIVAGAWAYGPANAFLADQMDRTAVMSFVRTGDIEADGAGKTGGAGPSNVQDAPDLGALGFHATRDVQVPILTFWHARKQVYRNVAGDAVVLLSARDWLAPTNSQWRARRVGRVRLLSWTAGGMRYVLTGYADTPKLMIAADTLSHR